MLGMLYIVKYGDTLWDIANRQLGNPLRWTELYEHNNKDEVALNTGMKITDPDLIFVGQKLYIPSVPNISEPQARNMARSRSAKLKPNAGKTRAKQKIRSVPFKYSLDKLPTITVASPTHIASVSLKGSITLQGMNSIDVVTITRQGFEIAAKRQADHAFGKLVSETQIGYNPSTNEITFECGITSHSNSPYSPKTKAAAGLSTKTGLPVLKGSVIAPKINGKILNHLYTANSLGIEIELTPRRPMVKHTPLPQKRSASLSPESSKGWDYLVASALVAGAGVIIVATIAEDIVTFGAGIADDAPSFAAAAAMFTGGVALFQTVNMGIPIQVEGQKFAHDKN